MAYECVASSVYESGTPYVVVMNSSDRSIHPPVGCWLLQLLLASQVATTHLT